VQTLIRRDKPPAELIVIDECHHATADSYQSILDAHPKAKVLGLSGTPFRTDGRGLGDLFGELVVAAYPDELCETGVLHRPKVWASKSPDLRGVKVLAGDYQLGALANGYFNVSRSDTVSPASMVGLFGNGFTNKTYFAGLFNKMYLREDHWRTKIALGFGDIKFQTFVEVPPGVPEIWAVDDNGEFIDYSTNIAFAYAEGMALAGSRIYLGLRLVYSGTETVFDSPLKPDETTSLFGFGFAGEYDVRDNVFTPFKGMNIKLKTFTFLEALGSSDNYNRITFDVNKYIPVSENATLLLRFFSNISFGKDVPFVGKKRGGAR
jgi:hypothetical protein